jgi:hypothetical protein
MKRDKGAFTTENISHILLHSVSDKDWNKCKICEPMKKYIVKYTENYLILQKRNYE